MLTVVTHLLHLPGNGFQEDLLHEFPRDWSWLVSCSLNHPFGFFLKIGVIYLLLPSHLLISKKLSKMTVSVIFTSCLSPLGKSLSGLCCLMVTRARHADDHCIPKQSFHGSEQQIQLCVTPVWPLHYLYQEVTSETFLDCLHPTVLLFQQDVSKVPDILMGTRACGPEMSCLLPYSDQMVCDSLPLQSCPYWPLFQAWPISSQPDCWSSHREAPCMCLTCFFTWWPSSSMLLPILSEELGSGCGSSPVAWAVSSSLCCSCSDVVLWLHVEF